MHKLDVGRVLKAVCSRSASVSGLGLLTLLAQVASAQGTNPLSYFKNYFVTGDYVVGGVGLSGKAVNGSVSGSITLNGVNSVPCTSGPGLFASVVPCSEKGALPADVIAAFLYWQTIETPATPSTPPIPTSTAGTFNATPANPNPFNGLALGNPEILACAASGGGTQSGEYMHVYRADVLKYLPINTTANVRVANGTQTFTLTSTSTNTQFNGATLVVVYRLVTPGNPRIAPLRAVVIYDGAFTGAKSTSPSLNQTIPGIGQAAQNNQAGHMTQVVGNGQPGFSETLMVNGAIPQGVPSDPFVGAQGKNWDNYTFNINVAPNASSVVTTVESTKDCLSWAAIITSTNVQDSDSDGLLDIWETSGLYFNPGVRNDGILPQNIVTPSSPAVFGTCTPQNQSTCLNLPAMGASPYTPDIFVQIDWMQGAYGENHVHNPQLAALNMVGAVFASHGVNLHFDVGTNSPTSACETVTPTGATVIGPCAYQPVPPSQKPLSPYIIPALYSQGGNLVEESGNLLCPNPMTSTCAFPLQSNEFSVLGWKEGFEAIKNGDSVLGLPQLFANNRKDTFHYALFGHAIAATTPLSNPEAGSISGVGDLPGGDFMITLGLWRSDTVSVDQVGTVLDQAGTLMHELGHNLDLHHAGWNNNPVCMPDYPSVMNYLYQVAGLTDSSGVEHIDYSYGLELLPLNEDFLSSSFPLGIQTYRTRYFGPFNSAINTPGQASQVYCTGQLLPAGASQYVRMEGPAVSTPDWSNGLIPLKTVITKGLDINYDGTVGETFIDQPDWISLNLQQVSARSNTNGLSVNVGIQDLGIQDLGIQDLGIQDLGQDALGDQDYATYVLSGALPPPTNLTVAVTPAPTTPPYAGGTGNTLNWIGNTGQASKYNVYRCNGSAGACTPTALASVSSGTPVVTTYTDLVNDSVHAGSTCPATSTCYNTTYYYYVTEVSTVGVLSTETGASNTVNSDVTHMFVVANSQTLTYGATNPTPTFTVYSNVAPAAYSNTALATLLPGVSCGYNPAPLANANGYFDAGNYPIICNNGPAAVPGTAEGVTYYTAASPSLVYPTTPNLGGTVTQGSLTINPLPITVTAVCSTKVYNATTAAGTTCTPPSNPATPTITTNSLVSGDTSGFTESYDNANVNSPVASHVMTPAGRVNDNNGGNNYKVTFVNSAASSVITPASLTITATTNTKTYNASTNAAAIPAVTGLQGSDTVTGLVETYSTKNVGTGLTLTVSLGYTVNDGNGGNNYTVTTATNTTGVITQAPLTITAATNTKTYDSTTSAAALPTTSGLQGTDTVSGLAETYAFKNAGTGLTLNVSAGYTVNDGNSGGNYAVTSVSNTTGVINKATLTITATTNTKTYDGGTSAVALPTVSGLQGNSDSVTGLAETYASKNAGTGLTLNASAGYTVNDGNGGGNYTVTPVSNTTGVINKAPLTITATTNTKTYDGTTAAAALPTTSGLQTGDTVTGLVETYASKNAGTGLTLTVSAGYTVNDGNNGGNYTITTATNTTGVINKAQLTITAVTNSKPYDGTTSAAATPTTSGLQTGDTVTGLAETYNTPYAGTGLTLNVSAGYTVNDGNSGSNYTVTTVNVSTGVITSLPVTAAIIAANKTYDTTTAASANCLLTSGVLPADASNVGCGIVGVAMFASANASPNPQAVTAVVSLIGSAAGNYALSSVTPGMATISPFLLTVTANGVNKDFDGTTTATVTFTDNSFMADAGNFTYSYTASFASADPGTGIAVSVSNISLTGPASGNYSLPFTSTATTANILDTINLSALSLNGVNYFLMTPALPTWTGTALQLTNTTDETASAWLGTAIPVSSAFTTTFQFQITPAETGPNSIADGFAFVIQADPAGGVTPSDPGGASALGTTGMGGYIGYTGIPKSIAIEFDTYQNGWDPVPASAGGSDAHVGIQSNGPLPNSPDHTTSANLGGPVLVNFADGGMHTATITYDGSSIISVYLDGSATPVVSGTVTGGLGSFLGLTSGNAYLGFTAATGGGQENSDILSWTWDLYTPPPPPPAP